MNRHYVVLMGIELKQLLFMVEPNKVVIRNLLTGSRCLVLELIKICETVR